MKHCSRLTSAIEIPSQNTPEHMLVMAILYRALGDIIWTYDKEKKGLEIAASNWVYDDQDVPFTFIWCCRTINMDPSFVRRKLEDALETPQEDIKRRQILFGHGKTHGRPNGAPRASYVHRVGAKTCGY